MAPAYGLDGLLRHVEVRHRLCTAAGRLSCLPALRRHRLCVCRHAVAVGCTLHLDLGGVPADIHVACGSDPEAIDVAGSDNLALRCTASGGTADRGSPCTGKA